MTRRILSLALLVLTLCAFRPALALEIERVISPGGIEAWLVQDQKVPVISMEFSFQGGAEADPADKQGLSNMLSTLLDEGAGPYDSQEFQRRLRDNNISLSFDSGRDAFYGSLSTLAETREEAVNLTRLSLTEPRFDAEAVERMRRAILTGIQQEERDPDWISRRAFFKSIFPDHPYGQRAHGNTASVSKLTPDDLRTFMKGRFARDNLKVAVSGAITPEELGPMLDRIFGNLPEKALPLSIANTAPKAGGEVIVASVPIPQTIVLVGQQGVKRADPDWFAASIMNYVLGGGGFNSHLMNEIREKRGLTYGVSSYLAPMDHAALIMAGGSTANKTAGAMLDLMKQEWSRMAAGGITEQELTDAKAYLTGSFPLQLDSTGAIAGVLLQIQQDNLGIDYLNRRDALINAVTVEDVKRVAQRLLHPDALTVVLVGQPEGVKATRTIEVAERS